LKRAQVDAPRTQKSTPSIGSDANANKLYAMENRFQVYSGIAKQLHA